MNLDNIVTVPLADLLEDPQSPTYQFPPGDPESPSSGSFSLQISPASAVIQIGASYQFAVFKTQDGVVTDVTALSSFHSSNPTLLAVTIVGLATAGSATPATVVLTSAYAGQIATASVRVTTACSAETAVFALAIDQSLSMSREFSTGVTKLATAKLVALDFDNVPDYPNDAGIVINFAEIATSTIELTVKATVDAAISAVAQASKSSTLYGALAWAQLQLAASSRTIKVVILLTDGESKLDPDAVLLAILMKAAGFVIMAANIGGGAVGYSNLMSIVTPGMLATGTLTQLKNQLESFPAFLCSGNASYGNLPTVKLTAPPGVGGAVTGVVVPAVSTCGKTDVVFAIDRSTLMVNAIENLKANITNILADLTAASVDYAIGLVTFGDDVTVVQTLADGVASTVETAALIAALETGATRRYAQAGDEALRTIIQSLGTADRTLGDTTNPTIEPVQTGGTFTGWRDGSTKIIILITNSPPGGFTDINSQTDQDDAHDRALEAAALGIRIACVYPHDLEVNSLVDTTMRDYSSTTGGLYAKMPATSALFWAVIREIVRTCGTGPMGSTSGVE